MYYKREIIKMLEKMNEKQLKRLHDLICGMLGKTI